MLYIAETPIHFGLIIFICIILLVLTLFTLIGLVRSEKETVSGFAGFLATFFGFFTFLPMAISIYLLPATATVDQLLPYYLGAWSFAGLHAFFIVFYLLGIEYFKKRMWTIFLPFIGTLSWMIVLWILPTPTSTIIVSDGFLNYVAMPITLIGYTGFLAIFYMFLLPLYVTYTLTKERERSAKRWTWITWLGYFLWFIGVLLLALVQFTAPYMLYIFGLIAVAFIIVLIGLLLLSRTT